jgi:glycosyltransferase involved in cell wall biosynthesis
MTNLPTVEIWHTLLWSPYKANIFSELFRTAEVQGVLKLRFYQIWETDRTRAPLSPVKVAAHRYPYRLMFPGFQEEVSPVALVVSLGGEALRSDAELVVLAGYDRPEYWLQLLLLKLRGKNVGVFCDSTLHDNPKVAWRRTLKTLFFRSCAVVLCYGRRSAEYVAGHGVPWSRIKIGCQSAELPESYDGRTALAARIAAQSAATHPEFLFVGRLAPEKGVDTLLAAFARLHKVRADARLRIVGSGLLRDDLERQAEALGVAPAVEFTGSLTGEALLAAYRRASCLVLPSRSEPWGLVVNEALAQGCPAIASDHCGCVPELIIDQRTGLVVLPDDVDALARSLERALDLFRDTEAVAAHCIETIAPFTPSAAAENIHSALCAVVRGQR